MAKRIEIGDRIKFTVITAQGLQTATRKVVGFYGVGDHPVVAFRGYTNFIVRRGEIKEVLKF